VSRMLLVERQSGARAIQPWVLDNAGRRLQAHDHDQRLAEMRKGLVRHPRVRAVAARAGREDMARTLNAVHDPALLRALARSPSSSRGPMLMAQFAAPGMEPDTPVCAEVTAAAFEGVRSAITAARLIVEGERFVYALCGPPGHHAGPGWLGGCCYLNNAAAAVHILREANVGRVGILDLDIHYPNGTAAMVASLSGTTLHSLHAWPVVNAPGPSVQPCCERERAVEFRSAPSPEEYLEAVAASIDELTLLAEMLVLSLGYDTVAGDPHGCWSFPPEIFAGIGRLLAAAGLPVCVVQEGGYALDKLAACSYAFASGLLRTEEVCDERPGVIQAEARWAGRGDHAPVG
jgi:acetoin utilization deacetylase AcuC-like enzyme